MKMQLNAEIQKKVSKENKEYYVLYLEELGKQIFLNDTEVKLLKLLLPREDQ